MHPQDRIANLDWQLDRAKARALALDGFIRSQTDLEVTGITYSQHPERDLDPHSDDPDQLLHGGPSTVEYRRGGVTKTVIV